MKTIIIFPQLLAGVLVVLCFSACTKKEFCETNVLPGQVIGLHLPDRQAYYYLDYFRSDLISYRNMKPLEGDWYLLPTIDITGEENLIEVQMISTELEELDALQQMVFDIPGSTSLPDGVRPSRDRYGVKCKPIAQVDIPQTGCQGIPDGTSTKWVNVQFLGQGCKCYKAANETCTEYYDIFTRETEYDAVNCTGAPSNPSLTYAWQCNSC